MRPSPMRIACEGLMLVAAIGVGQGEVAHAQDRTETVFREARAYTVRIRTQITTPFLEDERGSFTGAGFLVDAKRRWVVTNAHVVGHSPSTVQAAFADGEFQTARKIYVDSFSDIAVIEVADDGRLHPVAPLHRGDPPQVGEGVGAFGHPLDMPFTGTRGIVSGLTDQFAADLIQIDATVDHGNSGGPVIALASGKVVGIATAKAGRDKVDRLNFATPIAEAGRVLELLRQGIPPNPPLLEFSLLVDEDERHTLEVGQVLDSSRWPFLQGDRIVAVGKDAVPIETLNDLVTALRGRRGTVPIRIVRDGKDQVVRVEPRFRPSVVARRALNLDGVLIAPLVFEDGSAISPSPRLVVHSIEDGSAGSSMGFQQMDVLESVDGRRFDELDALIAYVNDREAETPLRIVYRRVSDIQDRWFDYHQRELPGEVVEVIGGESELLTQAPE